MSTPPKFPINPKNIAQVRDEVLAAAKKSRKGSFIVFVAMADEILISYGNGQDVKGYKKKKLIISVT